MSVKSLLADVVFIIHFIIFLLFPVLFFIPSRVWPWRIEFHFYFAVSLCVLFYVWGLIWTLKLRDKVYKICMLDTCMQWLRGYSLFDKNNYEHSFVVEVFERFALKNVRPSVIPWMLLMCIVLTAILYVLKLRGIILW